MSQAESQQYTITGLCLSIWPASLSSCRSGWLTAPGRWSSAYSFAGSTSTSCAPCLAISWTVARSIKVTICTILRADVEALREIAWQGQGWIELGHLAARLQRAH